MSAAKRRQRRHRDRGRRLASRASAARSSRSARSAGRPTMLKGRSGIARLRAALAERGGHLLERRAAALLERSGDAVARVARAANTALMTSCWFLMPSAVELARRALGLAQRGAIGPRHEHDGRARAVGQRLDALRRTAPPASSARSAGRGTRRRRVVDCEEARPRARQAEQPQRVPGRRGVEEDVIERHGSPGRPRGARRTRRTRRSRPCTHRRAARAARRAEPPVQTPRYGAITRSR